jgi:hypothetical protein
LVFKKGQGYAGVVVGYDGSAFDGLPTILVAESGNAGTWTLVKAEEIQPNRFKVAAIRHDTSLAIHYTARVAWAAIGKRKR